jgi:hypothetical protein
VALIGMLAIDGTLWHLVGPLMQQLALLFVRPRLPSAEQSEAMRQDISDLTEEVRAETARTAKLREQLAQKKGPAERSD